MDIPSFVTNAHRDALHWFEATAGQEISWPGPLNGMFLVNKAKGIHKPEGLEYALSVRHSLSGPYEDSIGVEPSGGWSLRYAHEGDNPEFFTNRALRRCMADGVPVGVVVQVKQKPNPRYRVLGLGQVVGESGPSFFIRQAESGVSGIDVSLDALLPPGEFDAKNLQDARERVLRSIARRRGQPAFRKELLRAYGGRCAITGCSVTTVLEAAHIIPYLGSHTNHIANGLLLRADLHTLFDLGLIAICPQSRQVRVHSSLLGTDYAAFAGKEIGLPKDKSEWPSEEALGARSLAE